MSIENSPVDHSVGAAPEISGAEPLGIDLKTLIVKEIYAHSVPLKPAQQVITTGPCKLNNTTKSTIQINLRSSLSKHRLRLEFKTDVDKTKNLIKSVIIDKNADLLKISQDLSKIIYDNQPGNSSSGILLVANAECDGENALALLKLDNEDRITPTEVHENNEVLYDLSQVVTLDIKANKIFKAALFVAKTGENNQKHIHIIASDHQADGRDGKSIADFFLKNCLECDYIEDSKKTTAHFVDTILKSASSFEDPEALLNIITALTAELKSSDPTIPVDQFVTDFVPEKNREEVRSLLHKNNIQSSEIIKDTSEIDEKKFLVYDLSSNIRIIGPKYLLENHGSSFISGDDDSITIKGTIIATGLRKRR
jgi:hypothetical protein